MAQRKCYVVHGHFYQPIRLNPFVGEIDVESSAYPYDNWNFRLLRECYLPNAYAHVKEGDLVLDIVNNYKNTSFDIGYTLLSWLSVNSKEVLDMIKQASSNAMALSFNHTILPLDPKLDKEIQVYWGIKTHEYYFGITPKGMWLPECAVDLETLEVLNAFGIEYVVLAPHQVSNKISKNYGYIKLKNGSIKAFIYDGILSAKLSFEDLLTDVEKLSESLRQSGDNLPIIATDGETFGHHKKFGEMGLAYLSKLIELKSLNELFQSLKDFDYEFKLVENTSWSCPHGIERWRTHCGCNSGAHPDWQQYWRQPLREAFEFLRKKAMSILENALLDYNIDKRDILLNYIDVILGKTDVESFLETFGIKGEQDKKRLAKLLTCYKYVQFMFSSDAWFFDDVAGLETVHALTVAKYIIYLLKDYEDLEIPFTNILGKAKGNTEQRPTAKHVYIKDAKAYTLENIALNIAILYHNDYLKDSGVFTRFYYEITKEQNYIYVFIKDLETIEKNSYEFSIKELNINSLFGTFKHNVIKNTLTKIDEKYFDTYKNIILEFYQTIGYTEDDMELLRQEKRLLESMGTQILTFMFKKDYPIEDIINMYKLFSQMKLNIKNPYVTKQGSKYLYRKAKNLPGNESEFLKVLGFVNAYNKNETNPQLMIGLWETQNVVWFKKELIDNKSILDALHLVY